MRNRPPELFQLFSSLDAVKGLGPKRVLALEKSGVKTPKDLLFTLPNHLVDRRVVHDFTSLPHGRVVSLIVRVLSHFPNANKRQPYRILVEANGHQFHLVFFHARTPWLEKTYPIDQELIVSGKLELQSSGYQMIHPDYTVPVSNMDDIPKVEPVYPLTDGITQKIMQAAVNDVVLKVANLKEWNDTSIITQENWPTWSEALEILHHPKTDAEAQQLNARNRLAYDELLSHQLTLAIARRFLKRKVKENLNFTGTLSKRYLEGVDFDPTGAQIAAVDVIAKDLESNLQMNRLLQGDVGYGKTLVAILSMLNVAEAGHQAAIMAPTEILARQHAGDMIEDFAKIGVKVDILTGRDIGKLRLEKLAKLKSGETQVLIGTHALFQKDVEFKSLKLTIIDEQHRFGVQQRLDFLEKGSGTHMLMMTATPIPRSLALANFGDMDVSILDEQPKGRKPVETVLVSASRLPNLIERIKSAIGTGRQIYWVCPLVGESEHLDLAAADERASGLQKMLGMDAVGLVHGQLSRDEKDKIMSRFIQGDLKLLVATTVIEVGVNVPNASIMVIEDADRFGLAQLHQLRGRVGRGSTASSCVLLHKGTLGKTAQSRLNIMRETNDGFKIAEMDLKLRGAGDFLGHQQSGLPKFKIADIERDARLLQIANKDAKMVMEMDPKLEKDRGKAIQTLLDLHDRKETLRLFSMG